jgi:hypothetical protein
MFICGKNAIICGIDFIEYFLMCKQGKINFFQTFVGCVKIYSYLCTAHLT